MTIMLIFFYSSNSDIDNKMVRIGGMPSIRNPFSKINRFQRRLVKMRKQHGEKTKEESEKKRKIVKIVSSINKFGPQNLNELISRDRLNSLKMYIDCSDAKNFGNISICNTNVQKAG